jgi:peptide/nickel transport system permease protein
MLPYVIKRVALMVPVLLAISFLVFFIVELPPGDALTHKCMLAKEEGRPLPPGCEPLLNR